MQDILIRSGFFLLMVVFGYVMKKLGVLTKEDGIAVSRVVLNITLPCAILVSFKTFQFDISYVAIPVISFAANWFMLLAGWLISRRQTAQEKIFYMLECPAYNIGTFTLPFVSGILGATGVVATCLFDMGNSPMCLGINFMLTAWVVGANPGRSLVRSVLSVFTRPAFTVYFVMFILSIFSVQLPDVIYDFAGTVSPANGPMAMIMIGLMLEFSLKKSRLKEVITVNALRLALAALIAFLFYSFTPFPYEVRKAVAITAFSPISSASPAFVAQLKGDVELVGFASTISIISALVLIPVLFALL